MCLVSVSQCYIKVIAVNASNLLRIKDDFKEEQCPSNSLIEPYKSSLGFEHLENNRTKPNRKCEKAGKCKSRREKPTPKTQNDQPKSSRNTRLKNSRNSQASKNPSKVQSDITPKPSKSTENDKSEAIIQNDQSPQLTKTHDDQVAQQERNQEKTATGSLTFVFDSTGSMWNDLIQVKVGAAKILETMLESSCNHPIYNFVLVPFRDPGKLCRRRRGTVVRVGKVTSA